MERDLTSGSVWKNIVYFSLPYLLSYFLQTLYGLADLFIVGQFDGVASTTAVSIGSQAMHMLTVMIVGLAMGTTVNIGRAVGARDTKKASKVVGNTMVLFIGVSVVLAVVLLLLVRPIVNVMSTPAEAVEGTVRYLTICFIGIPFITAYNVIASIFRGLGDSKSPMYFIAIACVANIALDYIFIGAFHMGPEGAALGTTLSQTISVVVSLWVILKKQTGISVKREDFRPDRVTMGQVLKIGIPIAAQDGFIQVAFIIITIIANRRGLSAAAQNMGAGKYERADQILRYAMGIAVGFGLFVSLLIQVTAETAVGLFTTDAVVILLGAQYIRGYIWDCIFAGVHFSFSGYFCAYGRSEISFIHNLIAILCVRIPGVYLTSKIFPDTLFPMGLATATGSLLSVIICMIAFGWLKKQEKRKRKSA